MRISKKIIALVIIGILFMLAGIGSFKSSIGAGISGLLIGLALICIGGFIFYRERQYYKAEEDKNIAAAVEETKKLFFHKPKAEALNQATNDVNTLLKQEVKQTIALPIIDDVTKPIRKLTIQLHKNGTDYELAYHYDDINIACCTMPEYSQAAISVNVNDDLFLVQEFDNEYDNKAVAIYTKTNFKVGYLHKGKLQDMANDWIAKKLFPIVAFAVDSPVTKMKLGFYDLAQSEKNIVRLNSDNYKKFKLAGSSGAEAQDIISCLNIGEPVNIEYDYDTEKYIVTDDYGLGAIGSIKSTKLSDYTEYDACVAAIDENDNGKSMVTIAIFNA